MTVIAGLEYIEHIKRLADLESRRGGKKLIILLPWTKYWRIRWLLEKEKPTFPIEVHLVNIT